MFYADTTTKQEAALIVRWLEALFPCPPDYEERRYWKSSQVGSVSSLALSRIIKGEPEISPKWLSELAFSFEVYPPRMPATALGL